MTKPTTTPTSTATASYTVDVFPEQPCTSTVSTCRHNVGSDSDTDAGEEFSPSMEAFEAEEFDDGSDKQKMEDDNVTSKGSAGDVPECWTQSQLIEKTKSYPWLIVRNRKLGCKTCRNVKNIKTQQTASIHLSSAWINVSVEATGRLKSSQLVSLRKKMFKHRNSGGHKAAERILATTENKVME